MLMRCQLYFYYVNVNCDDLSVSRIQYSDPKFPPDFIFSAKRLKNAM